MNARPVATFRSLVLPAAVHAWAAPGQTWPDPARLVRLVMVDSCLWTAATLAALPLLAAHVLHLPLDLRPSGLIFFSGMLIYNLDHLADSHMEAGGGDRWARGIGRSPLVGIVLSSASAICTMLWLAPPAVALVFISYALVGVIYGLPLLPPGMSKSGRQRLKDIPGLKNMVVASSVSIAAVGLPLAYSAVPFTRLAVLAALFPWVLVMSNATMCDVGDLQADRRSGVPTLPVLLGVSRTRLLVLSLNVLLFSVFAFTTASGQLSSHPEVLLSATVAAVYSRLVTERTAKHLLSLVLDGCTFIPFTLVILLHETHG
ncbi:MAG: UbiA family prenyltransferase [Oligoflexia bacterium]|nr:UbiA family prenyltransferase [Oligoflexia bacterium]